jgi:hypothetical protein
MALTTTAAASLALPPAPAFADGLIQSLPPDGSWVEFEALGEGRDAAGVVKTSFTARLTLRSVGRETVDDRPCRWIEIETGARKGDQSEIIKLLIPERAFVAGENPRAHVLKAKKKDANGERELDLKAAGAREIETLDELFHAPLSRFKKPEPVELKTPAGTFECTLAERWETSDTGEFRTRTWRSDAIPFGVAAYHYNKARTRNGAPQMSRGMELKAVKFGNDARSAISK